MKPAFTAARPGRLLRFLSVLLFRTSHRMPRDRPPPDPEPPREFDPRKRPVDLPPHLRHGGTAAEIFRAPR